LSYVGAIAFGGDFVRPQRKKLLRPNSALVKRTEIAWSRSTLVLYLGTNELAGA